MLRVLNSVKEWSNVCQVCISILLIFGKKCQEFSL